MKLSAIAADIGVSNSTAHRLLTTLREKRFVRQEQDSKRYELGSAMLFTGTVSALEHCVEVSAPVMRALNRQTGETIHLSVLRDKSCLFAASVESDKPIRVTSRVGQSPLAHTAAGGKILLAALAEEKLAAIYKNYEFEQVTKKSIPDFAQLLEELKKTRKVGYARNLGESEIDMYALAVPIHNPNGRVISSLTIAAPLSRIISEEPPHHLNEHEKSLLQDLLTSAKKIETMLAF